MKRNIVYFRQGMYCERIMSRFWEIHHLIECHISLWPDFALSIVFFYFCFYERHADKPARPIGWLGLCERKYCLLCRVKVSWKHFEPFWRNIASKIVMSRKLLPRFRHICWFFSIYVSMHTRLTNQRGQSVDEVHVKGYIVYLTHGKYYEKISSRFEEMQHLR